MIQLKKARKRQSLPVRGSRASWRMMRMSFGECRRRLRDASKCDRMRSVSARPSTSARGLVKFLGWAATCESLAAQV